jgi:hypothetical protein
VRGTVDSPTKSCEPSEATLSGVPLINMVLLGIGVCESMTTELPGVTVNVWEPIVMTIETAVGCMGTAGRRATVDVPSTIACAADGSRTGSVHSVMVVRPSGGIFVMPQL